MAKYVVAWQRSQGIAMLDNDEIIPVDEMIYDESDDPDPAYVTAGPDSEGAFYTIIPSHFSKDHIH